MQKICWLQVVWKFYIVLILVLSCLYVPCYSQSAFDTKLKELAESVSEVITGKQRAKVAVWHFVNTQGEITDMGKFIAEDFSVYFTNASKGAYQVMDRNHLDQILREHKLNSEGFIDPETAKELGRMKAVDAVITGTVDILERQLKVRVKVLDTETALQVAAEIGYLPIDENISSFLGVPGLESGNGHSTDSNRGFNRPINSNEQYNNPKTVSVECEIKGLGDFCFFNNLRETVMIEVGNHLGLRMLLNPGQTQCFYNLKSGNHTFDIHRGKKNREGAMYYGKYGDTLIGKGEILIEKCKSKTYTIR